jgi:hypothetical protein
MYFGYGKNIKGVLLHAEKYSINDCFALGSMWVHANEWLWFTFFQ